MVYLFIKSRLLTYIFHRFYNIIVGNISIGPKHLTHFYEKLWFYLATCQVMSNYKEDNFEFLVSDNI